MAAIDKTYLNTREQYEQVAEWCKDKLVWDNPKIYASEFINEYTEEDWKWLEEEKKNGKDHSIILWNTPTYFDVWLIRNCPIDFIQDRLKEQYDSEYDEIKNGTSEYDTFKRENWITPHINYREDWCCLGKNQRFEIEARTPDNWWFNYFQGQWYDTLELRPTNCCHVEFKGTPTKRKINRILSKWSLPKGTKLRIETWYRRGKHRFIDEIEFVTK